MMNVCYNCGMYRADKIIDPSGPFAICPECGFKHPFRQLPLLIVSGAAGTGKSSVCQRLLGMIQRAVVLEGDILWRPEFDTPQDHYRDFFNTWLRMCKNISQSGKPVVLFGAGMGVPENLEPCVERRYLGRISILALVCDDEVLAQRLRSRPAWRQSGGEPFIQDHIQYNRWFKETACKLDPPVELVDTTHASIEQIAAEVAAWISRQLDMNGLQ